MPIFSMTPARMIEPAVGASVWASGSHVCSGNIGTLMANATAKARNTQRAVTIDSAWLSASLTRSNVSGSPVAWLERNTSARMPTSITAEPSIVYTKNFTAA